VKLVRLLPVSPPVVTRIGPVVAPVGTVAVICVAEFTVKVADVWLNLTAVAPVKFVPVITTDVPTAPLVGANELTVGQAVAGGATSKAPPGTVTGSPAPSETTMGPSVAPLGTTAVIWMVESVVNVDAVPLNVTEVTPAKPVPVIVTSHPTGPPAGV
jgi:hypothetical protein